MPTDIDIYMPRLQRSNINLICYLGLRPRLVCRRAFSPQRCGAVPV